MAGLAKKLLLACASVVVALLAAECAVRLTWGRPVRHNLTTIPAEIQAPAEFPGGRYVLRPGADVTQVFPDDPRGYFDPGASLRYRINSLGFRGGETTREKPSGVFRILGLGDSFTFGTGVRLEDTFLALLERRLRTEPGALRFEVLNLGVMGYATGDEVALLRHEGLRFDPDLVVIVYFPNDASESMTHRMFRTGKRPQGLARGSVLADRLLFLYKRRQRVAKLVASYRAAHEPEAPGWTAARSAFDEAAALAHERGFALVVAIFPVLWELSDSPFAEIHARVADFARERGIAVVDLLPAFAGFDGPELWVHATNQHPNERAHAVAGEALHAFLVESRLLPAAVDDGG